MLWSQDKPAYYLFNQKGKEVKYDKMIKELAKADVVFFGESHNNPISHWLELEITRDLHAAREGKIILGAEMFEADNQLILDEYLAGIVREKNFEDDIRLWNNYQTDYKPLVTFAAEKNLPFIATNIPRRYANLVFREGFEGLTKLSEEARQYIAPLPFDYDPELPGYKKMVEMMGGHGGDPSTFPKAQAAKDATMAHFIAVNQKDGHLFIHFNGSYHSENYEGIIWYLQRALPNARIATITTLELDDAAQLTEENTGKADFSISVPGTMTKTY